MEAPIVFTKVCKKYDKAAAYAVDDFSLTIKKGEFFCLVGPSGCGKSTVLKMIAGLTAPTSGQLVKPASVGMVFQSGAVLPWLTVEENVILPLKISGLSTEKAMKLSVEYTNMVGLTGFRHQYPRALSGGQRQRIGIARALVVETEVLLLDEPFSALDPLTTQEMHRDLLQIWRATGKTIVMVSHLLEEAIMLADRIGIMGDGRLKSIVSAPNADVGKIRRIMLE